MRKIQGKITQHISVEDIMWSDDTGDIIVTPISFKFMTAFEEWITWVKRPVRIHGMCRSKEYNKKVGGIANSNHLDTTACDFSIKGLVVDTNRFIKYAKKWKKICKKYGLTGEAGIYQWGMHFGIRKYPGKFYHWDSRSGQQKNLPFKI